ncbi:MAG: RNA-binding domain-containing protein [Chlorobiota bacterium]
MNKKKLRRLIEEGESSTVEFKRKLTDSKKIAKELCAFANTKGGTLIVGVDDDKTICGVMSEKSEANIIRTACDFELEPPITPVIHNLNIMGFELVVAEIEESNNKPINLLSQNENNQTLKRAYIRVGEKSVMASSEMARALRYLNKGVDRDSKGVSFTFGKNEKALFKYLEANERATVNDFAKLVNISRRRAERLMIRMLRAGVLQIHQDSAHDYFTAV